MNIETEHVVENEDAAIRRVPWTVMDLWLGIGLLILVEAGLAFLAVQFGGERIFNGAGLILLQLSYLLPIVVILAWRRSSWQTIGFGKFKWETLGIGCGLMVISYGINFIHNMILLSFGFETQGDMVMQLFDLLESPIWLVLTGVIFAPLVEEIFFRGFLFQGFRQKYGWLKAAFLSAAIFSASHFDLASIIPTFMLGFVFAWLYHRSNSIWPGVVLHFLANSSAFCLVFGISELQKFIPS